MMSVPAICEKCGGSIGDQSTGCLRCPKTKASLMVADAPAASEAGNLTTRTLSLVNRNYAVGSAVGYAFALVATKERSWSDNLLVAIGFPALSLVVWMILKSSSRQFPQVGKGTSENRWGQVVTGLAVVGITDWLLRTGFILELTVFVILTVALVLVGVAVLASLGSALTTDATDAAKSKSGSWNWGKYVVAVVVVATLRGQLQQPAKKDNIPQINAHHQIGAATEQFWRDGILHIARVEDRFPDPMDGQSMKEFLNLATRFLEQELNALEQLSSDQVALDAANLFRRHRGDLVELQRVIAERLASMSEADLNSPAVELAAIGDAARATGDLLTDKPDVAAFLALIQRLENHEVERAALQGKLIERFRGRSFPLTD
jgi:hypothetical protein